MQGGGRRDKHKANRWTELQVEFEEETGLGGRCLSLQDEGTAGRKVSVEGSRQHSEEARCGCCRVGGRLRQGMSLEGEGAGWCVQGLGLQPPPLPGGHGHVDEAL